MSFFFFNDTATTEIYTLSLHDALPIWVLAGRDPWRGIVVRRDDVRRQLEHELMGKLVRLRDRKSTRLNSSHSQISYAVFCLKKKNHHELGFLHVHARTVDKLDGDRVLD